MYIVLHPEKYCYSCYILILIVLLSLNPRNVDVKTPTIVTTEGIVA